VGAAHRGARKHRRTTPWLIGLLAAATVGVALPSAATAAVTCSFNSAGQQVDVVLSANGDQAAIRQEPIADGGRILVDPIVPDGLEAPCLDGGTPADHTNTDDIIISEPLSINTTMNIGMAGGGFVNTLEGGGHPDIEIYLSYATLGDDDTLRLNGTDADDRWAVGADGINFNAGLAGDADMDIVYMPDDATVEGNQFATDLGDDVIDGSGVFGVTEAATGLRMFGGGGEDELIGGAGIDSLSGDADDDIIRGRGGADQYLGGTGNDTLDGALDADGPDGLNYGFAPSGVTVDLSEIPGGTLNTGSEGVDTISGTFNGLNGSPHADVLTGGSGDETIRGQAGDDVIDGGPGDDALFGVFGNDLVRGGPGNDSLFGSGSAAEAGIDTVAYDTAPAGVTVDFAVGADGGAGSDGIAFFENVIGSPFADSITGDAGPNVLTGGGGEDQVFGLAGADTLLLRDGVADTGDCGGDTDTAVTDAAGVDSLIGCEMLSFPPIAQPPTVAPDCSQRKQLKKLKKARKKARSKAKKKRLGKQIRKLEGQLRQRGC
jgi:Ca2+-binding RTX toxin-like protein